MKFTFPKVNNVILIIIFSQFIFTAAAGLTTPLFAVFVLENIGGSAITVVGFAVAIYWICKSLLQIPIARRLDRISGEMDDHNAMLAGACIFTLATFLFYFSHEVWHIYALQVLMAIGDALFIPPFYAIFSRHLDHEHIGFEWSLFSSFSVGAGSALGGIFSGLLATITGIRVMFLINGTLMLIGFIILWFLRPYISPRMGAAEGVMIIEQKRP
ncbi:MAG: MFS transporter [Candidatus Sungbacteria bacterium]|nr:MFS transporter [Candidatus Sungbacteria bacterium]